MVVNWMTFNLEFSFILVDLIENMRKYFYEFSINFSFKNKWLFY